ncbi:MAG: hypothetical protein GXO27_07000 [Chlorobi bacterium]|nr:hypothetical protein [Chlorobiota bacterium]
MKKLLLLTFGFLLASCGTTRIKTARAMPVDGIGVIHKPVVAELEVRESKVTGEATAPARVSVESVKNQAIIDALQKADADVLVEPVYDIKITRFKIVAKVTGYPAVYKNFHTIREDEIKLLYAGALYQPKVERVTAVRDQRKLFWIWGGTVLALGLLGTLPFMLY